MGQLFHDSMKKNRPKYHFVSQIPMQISHLTPVTQMNVCFHI